MPGNVRPIDPARPDPDLIARAARTLRTGGHIIFPTSGLYGLGADATCRDAVDRIYTLKSRTAAKPILILIPAARDLTRWVTAVPPTAEKIIAQYWPGGITLIFNARPILPDTLTAGTGKIGIRVPAHPVARALISAVDFPVTATSANPAGAAGCTAISAIAPVIAAGVDLLLDAGPLAGGPGSTVIDVTVEPPLILRSGSLSVAPRFFCAPPDPAVDKNA